MVRVHGFKGSGFQEFTNVGVYRDLGNIKVSGLQPPKKKHASRLITVSVWDALPRGLGFQNDSGLRGFGPTYIVSIVVPFWGYLLGSYLYIWLNQKRNYNGDYR